MKKLVLGLILLAGATTRAELPLQTRDELTAREYVTCGEHAVTVRVESVSGRQELRTYKEHNFKLASVELVDLKTKHELKWKLADSSPIKPAGLSTSLEYKPTLAALEELAEEFENFRSHCQIQKMIRDNPFNPKLLDLAVVFALERERVHFYWQ